MHKRHLEKLVKGTVGALLLLILVGALGVVQSSTTQAAGDPIIIAAGDIACDPAVSTFNGGNGSASSCRQLATYNLFANLAPAAVLPLGDVQYYCAGYDAFLQSYALSWGKLKTITHPAVGNHEYLTSKSSSGYGTGCNSTNAGAAGYFKYFGAAAGDPKKGYYSYNVGAWHLIALNSNCSDAGGCGVGSPQETWLKSDLTAHPRQCILAYWHIPLWSSGGRANSNTYRLMQDLYNAGADVALTGHDHDYERFAPQDYDGNLDSARGIREIVVGTGGSDHTGFVTTARNSLVRNATTFGVLKMTLHAGGYDWQFLPEPGKTFTDSGSANCHNVAAGTVAPTPTPTKASTSGGTVTVGPVADAAVDSSNPSVNYGTATSLRTDASPTVNSYLRFNVQGLSGTVSKATLRLYNMGSSSIGFDVHGVSSNTWGETSVTFGNAPTMGGVIGNVASVTAGTWSSVDVTSIVKGNGLFSFALTTTGTTSKTFPSRESSSNAPQLIIQTALATSTPAAAPSLAPTLTPTLTPQAPAIVTETTEPTVTGGPTEVTPAATENGGTSTPSNAPSATPVATPTLATRMVVTPTADAYVYEADPTTNYGASKTLRVDNLPVQRSYLRFSVQGLEGNVSYASLRIYANSDLATGFDVNAVEDNGWNESTIDFTSAPAAGPVIGSSGPVAAGSWIFVDVTNYVVHDGTFVLALTPKSSTGLSLASRESGANAPQLILESGE